MQKKFNKEDDYYKILYDFQHFVQQCYSVEREEDWDAMHTAAGHYFAKYKKSPFFDFVLDLLNAHYKDVERRYLAQKGKNERYTKNLPDLLLRGEKK